jgi:hypothetical protein
MTFAEMLRGSPLNQQRMADDNAMNLAGMLARGRAGTVRQEPSLMQGIGGAITDYAVPDRYSDAINPSVMSPKLGSLTGVKEDGVPYSMADAPDPVPLLMDTMPMAGITAWHGSPHKFSKFDMSKIGTGEGAQAYGHGLYAAENPKVAKEYAKMSPMVDASPNRTFLGKELSPGTPEYHAGTLLEQSGMTIPKAKREVQGWIDEHIAKGRPQEDQAFQGWGKTLETLNQAKKKSDFGLGRKENLYKVDIPDDQIAKMLDWDKPLSEQGEKMHKVWEKFLGSGVGKRARKSLGPGGNFNQPTGEDFHSLIYEGMPRAKGQTHGGGATFQEGVMAADWLKRQGIPGIKYLDGDSRSGSQGTSNFVLFADEIAKILERNDQPIGDLVQELRKK